MLIQSKAVCQKSQDEHDFITKMYDIPNGGEYHGFPLGSSVLRLADR